MERDLESPFLDEELFARKNGESETEWEAHLAALEAESPFQSAFEQEAAYEEVQPPLAEESFSKPKVEVEHGEQELGASQGNTIYLPIQLNKTVPPKVGAFIPSNFQPTTAVDLIIYFHGHIVPECKTDKRRFLEKGIEYYWNTSLFKCLREDLVASGQKAILLAPTFIPIFASKSNAPRDYGDLNEAGKFDFLINETLTQLKKSTALPADAQVRNIILSAHSGGGLPMQQILKTQNSLKKNIVECWGFECLYFGTEAWEKWLKADQKKHFLHFRRKAQFAVPTRTLEKFKNFIDFKDGTDHCRMVQEKWQQAIDSSRVFQGSVGGKVSTSSITSGAMSGLFSLLAGLPGLATLPLTFMTALMEGFQDENHLTNLIFFARHPELGGRKLKASDPQSLKDEWVSILKTMVRPALDRLKKVATRSSASPAAIQPAPSAPVGLGDDKFTLTEWKLAAEKIVVARAGRKETGSTVAITEAPAVFLPEIIGIAREMAIKKKDHTLADKLDPATWFKKFTRITFLGRPLKKEQYLHLEMAKRLKAIESEMIKKYGSDAKSVGDLLLNKSDEGIAGSRLISGTATFSMHMFGLAVDVNYLGNPFIQKRAIPALNTVLKNAALLMNKPTLVYKHGQGFDSVQQLDTLLEKYFSLLDAPAELERLMQASSSSGWRGLSAADAKTKIQKDLDHLAPLLARGDTREYRRKDYFKKHAILDFDKRFVVQMEELGLSWGGHYGDMMHFDMRRTGVGFYIEKARLAYGDKARDFAQRLLKEKKYGTHPLV